MVVVLAGEAAIIGQGRMRFQGEEVLVPVDGQKYRFLLDSRVLKPERFLNRECSRKVYLFFKVSKSTKIGALSIVLGKI